MSNFIYRTIFFVGMLLVVVLVFGGFVPQGQVAARTIGIVAQVIPSIPIKPQEWLTDKPAREEVLYETNSGDGNADVYHIPGVKPKPAILLFLGVNPAGRDDERVVNLGSALARAGFVVMVPWSEAMINKQMRLEDVNDLVYAFKYLSDRDDVDDNKIGMAGFCVGSSMVAIAAQNSAISDQVALINFFGGYYDARDFLKQYASRRTFYGDVVNTWDPNKLTEEVIAVHLIEGLDNKDEQELLKGMFLDGQQRVDLSGSSKHAQTIYKILQGGTLNEVDQLIKKLPYKIQERLDGLSPSTNITNLTTKVFVMHDREDDLVPVEESMRLADALGHNRDYVYTEFSFFQHLDPTQRVSILNFTSEAFKLYRHLYGILASLR